jgi:hypothetical protein
MIARRMGGAARAELALVVQRFEVGAAPMPPRGLGELHGAGQAQVCSLLL